LHHPKDSRDLIDASRQTAGQQLRALLVAEVYANQLLPQYQVVENDHAVHLHFLLSRPEELPAHY
jgi:hypothetical protein